MVRGEIFRARQYNHAAFEGIYFTAGTVQSPSRVPLLDRCNRVYVCICLVPKARTDGNVRLFLRVICSHDV